MSTDYDEDDERDLEGDAAPASWQAPDEWWRGFVAGLDVDERRKLLAGDLSIRTMNAHGMERVPLVAPGWVRELGAAGG